MKNVQDHYFHRAKKEGYVARSVYKLQEIDQKHRLLKKRDRVLDLGCAPGSWLQYAARKVGSQGDVVGLDIMPVTIELPPHVNLLQSDIFEYQTAETHWRYFDIILSDMAPRTTGISSVDCQRSYNLCEQALHLAGQVLRPNGSLLVKMLQGDCYRSYASSFRNNFKPSKFASPPVPGRKAWRFFSSEKNIVVLNEILYTAFASSISTK